MNPEFEDRIISSLIGAQWLFTHSTVETLYHEVIALRERIRELRGAITLSIARSDDHADSYCSQPIRIALAEDEKHDG